MEASLRVDGDRVYLRPILPAEATAIFEGRLPDGLHVADGYPSPFTHEVMDIFVGTRRADSPTFAPMFIVRKEDDAIVGETGASYPDGPASPDVGYSVVEALWGRGYATDALKALVRYLFSRPQVEVVQANTTKGHVASRRVMEKAGMTLVREGEDEIDGEMQEVVYYEIRRPV